MIRRWHGRGCLQLRAVEMAEGEARFLEASPYLDDVLALPVASVDDAAAWYSQHFGLTEVERSAEPHATVLMERDGVRLGFQENGGDSSNDGAAILVPDIGAMAAELARRGVAVGERTTDERQGQQYETFSVVAPDQLCYYFYQAVAPAENL